MYKQLFHFLAYVLCVNLAAGMQQIDFQFEASDRSYLLYKPKNFDASKPINLVVGVHGYSGTASAFEAEVTGGFNKAADKFNFLAVYLKAVIFMTMAFSFRLLMTMQVHNHFQNHHQLGKLAMLIQKDFLIPILKTARIHPDVLGLLVVTILVLLQRLFKISKKNS